MPGVVLEAYAMAEDLVGAVVVEEAALVLGWVNDLRDELEKDLGKGLVVEL